MALASSFDVVLFVAATSSQGLPDGGTEPRVPAVIAQQQPCQPPQQVVPLEGARNVQAPVGGVYMTVFDGIT